ncbi:hypothetical protein Aduo_000871 [Ancylostoma duodenale]
MSLSDYNMKPELKVVSWNYIKSQPANVEKLKMQMKWRPCHFGPPVGKVFPIAIIKHNIGVTADAEDALKSPR